jgi:Flp pilus assembly protein TadD
MEIDVSERMTSENFKPAGKTNVFAQRVVLCLLLAAVTLVVYWPVARYDFVNYDDPDYFTSNAHVQTGLTLPNTVWSFSTRQTANWHPLTWLSLMLDAELFGKGPFGPHFTNLLFHLANTVLVFLLLRRLTAANWRSALVAALFALHPLHVESVAWISERKDVLSTFFGLLTLLFYAGYAQRVTSDGWPAFAALRRGEQVTGIEETTPAPGSLRVTCHASLFYGLALLFFALGLMSKPMLVTLPLVMLLLDWWPLGRVSSVECRVSRARHLVVEKIPFFILSMISCVVTFIVQQKGGAVVTLMKISLAGRIENAFVSYARYLGKTFWPVNLAVLYPHPIHWDAGLVVFSLTLVIGLSVAAVWLGRRFPFAFTGWFWFVGTLVPVIGLVQVGIQSLADRYTYVSLIGVFTILVWGLGAVCACRRVPRPLIILLSMTVLVACAFRTRDQLRHWQNDETLFRHALAVTKNNYLAYNNLGTWLSKNGQIAEAMDCFHKSLQINPDDSDVLYNLGNTFAKLGNWDEAINNYKRALQIIPNQPDILDNLGFAFAAKKQFADAIACFEAALKLNPDSADAHNNLATVLFIQKRLDEAIRHFREALRITPENPQIYSNLGDALVKQGQTAEAMRCYQEALRLKPGDPQIKATLQALGAEISN